MRWHQLRVFLFTFQGGSAGVFEVPAFDLLAGSDTSHTLGGQRRATSQSNRWHLTPDHNATKGACEAGGRRWVTPRAPLRLSVCDLIVYIERGGREIVFWLSISICRERAELRAHVGNDRCSINALSLSRAHGSLTSQALLLFILFLI